MIGNSFKITSQPVRKIFGKLLPKGKDVHIQHELKYVSYFFSRSYDLWSRFSQY